MYIIPLAWLYVALMMAVAEATNTNGTVLGGLITFVLYGLGPVLLVLYLMGSPARRKAIRAIKVSEVTEVTEVSAAAEAPDVAPASAPGAAPASFTANSSPAKPNSVQPISAKPDAGGHAPAATQNLCVAPVRKEP